MSLLEFSSLFRSRVAMLLWVEHTGTLLVTIGSPLSVGRGQLTRGKQ